MRTYPVERRTRFTIATIAREGCPHLAGRHHARNLKAARVALTALDKFGCAHLLDALRPPRSVPHLWTGVLLLLHDLQHYVAVHFDAVTFVKDRPDGSVTKGTTAWPIFPDMKSITVSIFSSAVNLAALGIQHLFATKSSTIFSFGLYLEFMQHERLGKPPGERGYLTIYVFSPH